MTEHWETFKAEFYRDGSLRDILVSGTNLKDWNRMAEHIAGKYRFRFSGGWSNSVFPDNLAALFPAGPDSSLTLLSIDVSGVVLNCHFFTEEEIELDLNPADIDQPSKLQDLFDFMSDIARVLNKDVVMTPEGMPEIPIFRVSPQLKDVEHTPFGGFV